MGYTKRGKAFNVGCTFTRKLPQPWQRWATMALWRACYGLERFTLAGRD